MSGPGPNKGSRMGGFGGMSGGFGDGDFGEASEDNRMMQAMAGSNAKSGSSGLGSGSSGSGSTSSNNPGSSNVPQHQSQAETNQPQVEPREVGEVSEEVKRGVDDVWTEVKKFFSINTWLGIDPENMSPEEQVQAKEFHGRYQQLDQEQQAVAKQMYQEKIQKKKELEEEENRKKEIEVREKEQSVVMPSSPQKGAQGPGGKSKKSQIMQKMKQDRTTIGTTQGE